MSAELEQAVYALLTPVRYVIDRHRNNGEHICLGCGQSWPCFDFGTALQAMDLVLRVHVAARRDSDTQPPSHGRCPGGP